MSHTNGYTACDGFTAYDAWILGRLRTGLANPTDLSRATADFQPIARRLFEAPLADRLAISDDWLADRADAEAIRRAVIHTDPTSPPPAPEAASILKVAELICAAEIRELPVEWLWRGRVPLGMLTLFAGDPKLGKSYVTIALAAAVSRGAPMPFGDVPEGPASVIIMSAEDDPARTVIPRLKAAGADMTKVHILRSIALGEGRKATPRLDADLQAIATAAAGLGDCRLIIVDPISSYLGDTDDHRNSELRGLLTPLGEMAERLRIAVVLVSHLSKGGGSNGKHRVMGSMAYVGVCRSNLIFVRDRTDPTNRRVLLCDNGGNLATPPPTMAYTIEELATGPAVVFHPEPVAITTEQALADELQHGTDRHQATERREAERWLKDALAAGLMPVRDIEDAAKNCGISATALKRARQGLGVVVTRSGFGKGSVCSWALPDGPPAIPGTA